MSAPATEELIGALAELRALFPDWRLGQLVANLVMAAGGTEAQAIWEIEDDQLLAAARPVETLVKAAGQGRRAAR